MQGASTSSLHKLVQQRAFPTNHFRASIRYGIERTPAEHLRACIQDHECVQRPTHYSKKLPSHIEIEYPKILRCLTSPSRRRHWLRSTLGPVRTPLHVPLASDSRGSNPRSDEATCRRPPVMYEVCYLVALKQSAKALQWRKPEHYIGWISKRKTGEKHPAIQGSRLRAS